MPESGRGSNRPAGVAQDRPGAGAVEHVRLAVAVEVGDGERVALEAAGQPVRAEAPRGGGVREHRLAGPASPALK